MNVEHNVFNGSYSCESGYGFRENRSSVSIVCQSNHTWSVPEAFCLGDKIVAQLLDNRVLRIIDHSNLI